MTFKYNSEEYFNGTGFYQQHLDTIPLEQSGYYEAFPHALAINTEAPSYTAALMADPSAISYSDWGSSSVEGTPMPHENLSPTVSTPTRTSSAPEPSSRPNPRRPSAEAVARRRKQNRISQASWRARNRELVEALRQEISEYSEYNESMHQTMKGLLQTTETLKGAIKSALAAYPPKRPSEDSRRTDTGELQLLSPASSNNDGANQDCNGDSVKGA